MNSIKSISVNLFNGVFSETLYFSDKLNILSGENGTGKTHLLRELKSGNGVIYSNTGQLIKIQAISPKRNSERKNLQTIIQQFKQQNKNFDNYIAERLSEQINDNTFNNYPSIGDLFYLSYEKMSRKGGNQIEYMESVKAEFNEIIKRVFANYEIDANWNNTAGIPNLEIIKNTNQKIPLESLSCGEQEILSLVLNIYTSRDSVDVFLIDEPEVHLNWHLEDMLFHFFKEFCEEYNKQMIISTHSRIIFKSELQKHTQFLYWDENKICVASNLSPDHKKKLAGEAIEIIKLGEFEKPTFFVEDFSHKEILELLSDKLSVDITVSESGNSNNVKSLFRLSKSEGYWNNSYFLIDGDNMGNPFPNEDSFIHLGKYCIENYFIELSVMSSITNKSEAEIKDIIVESIKDKKNNILKKNKYFEFLIDRLNRDDIQDSTLAHLDASEILPVILDKLGKKRIEYIEEYLDYCMNSSILESILPTKVVNVIKQFAS